MKRVRRKWPALRREVLPWLLALLGNMLLSGWAYALIEGVGPVSGPWWGVVTGSTTGYGDLYPHTTASRGVATWLILSSIIIDRIMSAKLVMVMVEEPNLYSDAEQEREEAKSDLLLAIIGREFQRDGMVLPDVTAAAARYSAALDRVQLEETERV